MNLLSHLFFAKNSLDDPLYVLGLIYPDLNRKKRRENYGSEGLRRGSDEHHETAKKFHMQDWFKKAQLEHAKKYPNYSFKSQATIFHCSMEITVDYELFRMHNLSDLIKDAENMLTHPSLSEFLHLNDREVLKKVNYLVEKRILESFSSREGCIRGMSRTYERITQKYPQLKNDVPDNYGKIFTMALEEVRPRMDEIMILLK